MRPEKKQVELSEDEKTVFKMLKAKSGLSNKQWDKSIKSLTGHKLAIASKTEESLFVEVL